MNELKEEYYQWMYTLICNDTAKGPTFHKLMRYLQDITFIPTISGDSSRYVAGINFRKRFGYEYGYSRHYIEDNLVEPLGDCRVFEMMVSLAFTIEERIMDDHEFGNRTGQWFWNMIVSLGLGSMDDSNFSQQYVDDVIDRFIYRKYSPNGKGGLFTLYNTTDDLTQVPIWEQAMWYLNENFDFTV